MAGPTHQDALVLLELMQTSAIRGMPDPLGWLSSPEYDAAYASFRRKYPPGTEMYEVAMRIVQHFDTLGVLWKHGLVQEDLAFDSAPVDGVWERIQGFVMGVREELRSPMYGAHFEMMARTVPGFEKVGVEQRQEAAEPVA